MPKFLWFAIFSGAVYGIPYIIWPSIVHNHDQIWYSKKIPIWFLYYVKTSNITLITWPSFYVCVFAIIKTRLNFTFPSDLQLISVDFYIISSTEVYILLVKGHIVCEYRGLC